jgi:hypothetical protein
MREPISVDVYHEQQTDELARLDTHVAWARIVWVQPEAGPAARLLLDHWICRRADGATIMWLHNQPYLVACPGLTQPVCVKVADIRRAIPADQTPPFIRSRAELGLAH